MCPAPVCWSKYTTFKLQAECKQQPSNTEHYRLAHYSDPDRNIRKFKYWTKALDLNVRQVCYSDTI